MSDVSNSSVDYTAMGTSAMDAAASIGAAYIAASSNEEMQQEALQHAERMSDQAYYRDLQQWNRQNLYNSPAAQMERLGDAGISRWAMFGQMNGGQADAVKAPIAATPTPPYMNVNMPVLNSLGAYMQIKRLHNENKLLEMNMEQGALENENKRLQNAAAEFYVENRMQREMEIFNNDETREQGRYEMLVKTHSEQLAEYQREKERHKHWQGLSKYDFKAKQMELEQMRQNIWETAEKIKNLKKSGALLDEDLKDRPIERRFKQKQVAKVRAEIKEKGLDNYIKERRKEMLRDYDIDLEKDPWYIKAIGWNLRDVDKGIRQMQGKAKPKKPEVSRQAALNNRLNTTGSK